MPVPPTGGSTTKFLTVSNVKATATALGFTVTFETSVPCLMAMDWWSQNDPTITTSTAVLEGVLRTQHSIASGAMPAGDHTGKVMGFSLRFDANDVSGYGMRTFQGTVQILGARSTAKGNALNTRWNSFAWNRYTWAQYNPKNETALVTP